MAATESNGKRPAPDWAALSDTGMRRRNNQDSFFVITPEAGDATGDDSQQVFIVADGMGAHAAGELASKLAVEQIAHHLSKTPAQSISSAEALERAVTQANNEIFRRGQANPEFRNMGTTVSVLSLLPEGAIAAHVGDSRIYRLRGAQLEQLTFDHSLVWEMTASGEVHEDAVRSGLIPKNVITRSLGPNPVVRVDLEGPFPIQKGDRFLLCSDGLTGPITDEELGVLMQVLTPHEAVQVMVDLANLRGGPDNITAIVVDAKEPSLDESDEETTDNAADDPLRGFSAPLLSVAVVCIAAAAAFAWFALWPLAIIVTVLGIVAVGTAVYQYQRRGQPSSDTRYRLGKGPYRKYHCVADQEMVSHFTQIIQSLREAAEENRWAVRWSEIEAVLDRGNIATSSSAFNEAVRNYALAIKQIMQQVRESDTKMASDSSIEY